MWVGREVPRRKAMADEVDPYSVQPMTIDQRPSPLAVYIGRMRGTRTPTRTRQPVSVVCLSWAAAALGIFLISIPSLYDNVPISTRLFLIGSFGASAALLYGAPHSDFAQPRNLVVGQLVAAIVGVTAYKVLGTHVGLAGALAVATTIVILQFAHSLHPPAGATALIAVLGPAQVHRLGYEFILTPVLAGSLILLTVAVVMNNLSAHTNRHYPTHWW
jgi:CBS-domain-containing membrane protein